LLGLVELKLILPDVEASFKNLNYQKFLLDSSGGKDKKRKEVIEYEKERCKKDWIYADRITGGGSHHSNSCSDVIASTITGKGKGKAGGMYE